MTLDFTAMAFYAAVCGGLALVAPSTGGWPVRVALGIIVGMTAATVLPLVQGAMGY